MASLKRKRLNSSSDEHVANTVESLRAEGSSRVQVGNSYTEVYNYKGRQVNDQCLRDLRTTDPRIDKKRIEKDKGGLMQGSYRWVLENSKFQQWRQGTENRLLWVKGDPGKGKTMLFCGLIDELTKSQHALSYFFCQATDSRINNATSVLRGLIYLLVVQDTSLTRHARAKWDHGGKSTFDPPNGLHVLCSMFQDILSDHSNPTYLVIDALDECEEGSLPSLLGLIVDTASKFHHVKWLVSSRNLPIIERGLGGANPSGRLDLSLEANAGDVSRAVADYIDHKVRNLPKVCSDTELHKEFKETMQDKANGTFLWAALVLGQLKKEEDDELENNWDMLKTLNEIPEGMTNLYDRMWRQLSTQGPRNSSSCKVILATMFLAYRPLQLQELSLLAGFKDNLANPGTLMKLVRLCGSFLTIQQDKETVHFVHQSAKDFLTSNKNAFDGMFPFGMGEGHHQLFSRSLTAMAAPITGLRQNIYGLHNPGVLTSEIEMPVPDPLAMFRYSCIRWLDHFYEWVSSKRDRDRDDANDVTTFLQDKYLYWLEALGLSRSITEGIASIRKLEVLAVHNQWDHLATLVRDARRFALANRQGIETAPLQVYVSALIFCPTSSWVRKRFETMIPEWINKKPTIQPEWDACLLTLEGHDSEVKNLAFSPDSRTMASSDREGTIKIWDPYTGACLNTISGSHAWIYRVAFLSEESSIILASAGFDTEGDGVCYSIKIWDPFNGGPPRRTFAMPNKMPDVITFIASSKTAVWVDEEGSLIKLDLDTGTLLDTIKLPANPIAVSPDGQTIITLNEDCCQVWDWCNTETARLTLDGCFLKNLYAAAVSPDGTKLALTSPIQVWDLITEACSTSLEINEFPSITSLAIPPDGTMVAFADAEGTIILWDATTDTIRVLSGHDDAIWALVVSPGGRLLASGCEDKTIKIWDLTIKAPLASHAGIKEELLDVLLSPNGSWVTAMIPDFVRVWSSVTGEHALDLPLSDPGWPIYDGDFKLEDVLEFSPCDKWLACWVRDGVKIWDTTTWEIQDELELQSLTKWASCVSLPSNNLARVLLKSETVEIWDLHTRKLQSTFSSSLCVAFKDMSFSPNGLWLALASWDTLEIRDWVSKEYIQVANEDPGDVSWCPAYDSLLHTSHGSYYVQGSTGNRSVNMVEMQVEEDKYPVQITEDGEWVLVQGKRILWVPSQYRPRFKCNTYGDPDVKRAVDWNKSGIAILGNSCRTFYIEFDIPKIVLKFLGPGIRAKSSF